MSETLDIRLGNYPSDVAVYGHPGIAKGVGYRLSHEMHDRVMNAQMVVLCASSFGRLARDWSALFLPH